jgi:hypothetical protein
MLVIEQERKGAAENERIPPPPVSGGKSMLATMVGLAFMAVGLWGMFHWWQELTVVLKGLIPISLFLGGGVAAVVGLASLKPSAELQKLADEHNRTQAKSN